MSPSKVPIFPVRLDSALKAAAVAAARKRHMSVSDWIRQAIIEQATRESVEVTEAPPKEPKK